MSLIEPWFLVAIACNFAGYAIYLAGLRRNLVEPNRASWLIWSASTAVEALTYAEVNPDALQAGVFLISSLLCLAVTVGIWARSVWSPMSRVEWACIAASAAALLLWLVFRETFWAHMLVVVAVPVSFWPTWQSVTADRAHERSPAWGLWTIGDLATLLVATRMPGGAVGEYGYLFVELLCHASVWFMIGLASINPLRSFGRRRGGLYVLDAYRRPADLFRVGRTHLGKAVFAAVPFAAGQPLLRFTGRRFSAARLPASLHGRGDRYVQITPDQFMGPSGRLDDLVNHSCDPNAGLRFTAAGVVLVAIRPIAPGEEVTWDYSTTLGDARWHMICQCRSAACRRVIGDFASLPADRRAFYRARDLVAPYLRDATIAAGDRASGRR